MTKHEFFEELNQLLEDISQEEKEEAIRYYENYFDDAGIENEEAILKELVSPQKVANSIKVLINLNEAEGKEQGYFTEKGYVEGINNNSQAVIISDRKNRENSFQQATDKKDDTRGNQFHSHSNQYSDSKQNNKSGYESAPKGKRNLLLLLVLGLFLLPVGIPLIISVLAVLFSVAVTVIVLWVAFLITCIAMLLSSVIVIVISFIQFFTMPAVGFLLAGIGLILFGVGILLTLVTIWMTRVLLPFLFNSIINLIKLPFKNRRALA